MVIMIIMSLVRESNGGRRSFGATLRNPNVELEGHSHDLFDTSNCFRHILEKDYRTGLLLRIYFGFFLSRKYTSIPMCSNSQFLTLGVFFIFSKFYLLILVVLVLEFCLFTSSFEFTKSRFKHLYFVIALTTNPNIYHMITRNATLGNSYMCNCCLSNHEYLCTLFVSKSK